MRRGDHPRTTHTPVLILGALLGALAIVVLSRGGLQAAQGDSDLYPLRAASLDALEAAFSSHDYVWPPKSRVPPVGLEQLPDGLEAAEVVRRKAAFFRSLLPLVLAENGRIRRERARLEAYWSKDAPLGAAERRHVEALADRYGVEGDLDAAGTRERLLRRVDVIPPALALAQAALESGWGTSRFAREGNSLFGQWTWEPGAGLDPERREVGKTHAVRSFPDLRASVRAYLGNLNRGHAYAELRRLRAAQRAAGGSLDPIRLAAGLRRYSERRGAYVEDVVRMMRSNALVSALEDVRLAAR